ncbi:hypothetical protein RRF57_008807 [Xylaria bambusicola]|uniref:2EXR domain-containing protein n=1 Tax=Xylaria bambusicola TaxID=326684 RepID=A0AAN7UTZ6_9PEZI
MYGLKESPGMPSLSLVIQILSDCTKNTPLAIMSEPQGANPQNATGGSRRGLLKRARQLRRQPEHFIQEQNQSPVGNQPLVENQPPVLNQLPEENQPPGDNRQRRSLWNSILRIPRRLRNSRRERNQTPERIPTPPPITWEPGAAISHEANANREADGDSKTAVGSESNSEATTLDEGRSVEGGLQFRGNPGLPNINEVLAANNVQIFNVTTGVNNDPLGDDHDTGSGPQGLLGPPTDFPKFEKLPAELRVKIWEMAMWEGRVIYLNSRRKSHEQEITICWGERYFHVPVFFFVSPEARMCAMQRYDQMRVGISLCPWSASTPEKRRFVNVHVIMGDRLIIRNNHPTRFDPE